MFCVFHARTDLKHCGKLLKKLPLELGDGPRMRDGHVGEGVGGKLIPSLTRLMTPEGVGGFYTNRTIYIELLGASFWKVPTL